jgi:hypothetical protein
MHEPHRYPPAMWIAASGIAALVAAYAVTLLIINIVHAVTK